LKNHFYINALASFFYVGYIPGAPGTWASLIAAIIWLVLPVESRIIQFVIVIVAFVIGIYVADLSEADAGVIDPSYVVIDEVVGMWLALVLLPKIQYPQYLILAGLAFIMFRIFDITKLFPINKLERMSGGLGIMIDDIAAGLFTGISINLIMWMV
jgi:phosphatidylglycerophosphatase A